MAIGLEVDANVEVEREMAKILDARLCTVYLHPFTTGNQFMCALNTAFHNKGENVRPVCLHR